MAGGYVYIMSNVSRTLYIGVTSDLWRRVLQHKQRQGSGFTRKCNCTLLVYWEEFARMDDAIAREKVLKGWLRARKLALVAAVNPDRLDLSVGWYD